MNEATPWAVCGGQGGGFNLSGGNDDGGGTNTAVNPVEMVLQAYGACLSIGYAMNAAVRGIKIHDLKIDLEGGSVEYVIMLANQMFCQQLGKEQQ